MKTNKQDLKINTFWKSINGILFKITNIEKTNLGKIIYYEKHPNKEKYSCLEGAFKERFYLIENIQV